MAKGRNIKKGYYLGVNLNPPDAEQREIVLLEQAGVPGIAIVGHSRLLYSSTVVEPHNHEGCIEIALCQRGALIFEKEGEFYNILPGELIINHPGEHHRLITNPNGMSLYWTLVRVEPLDGPLLQLATKERVALRKALLELSPQTRCDNKELHQTFLQIFSLLKHPPDILRKIKLINTSLQMLLAILQTSASRSQTVSNTRLHQIITMIKENPEKNYLIDDLAEQAALSSSRFIVHFKQITGMPPRYFMLACRISKAKRLLSTTDLTITNIAMDLGFDSSQHFANTFKRATGTTPTKWRKQKRIEHVMCKNS